MILSGVVYILDRVCVTAHYIEILSRSRQNLGPVAEVDDRLGNHPALTSPRHHLLIQPLHAAQSHHQSIEVTTSP